MALSPEREVRWGLVARITIAHDRTVCGMPDVTGPVARGQTGDSVHSEKKRQTVTAPLCISSGLP
jgi:hypothetical protein